MARNAFTSFTLTYFRQSIRRVLANPDVFRACAVRTARHANRQSPYDFRSTKRREPNDREIREAEYNEATQAEVSKHSRR